jgi:hypothetical protein
VGTFGKVSYEIDVEGNPLIVDDEDYKNTLQTIINVAKEHPGLNEVLFNTGAGHGNDPRVPYFIFVVERMFPTILAMSDLKAASLIYKHSDFQLAPFFLNTVDNKFNQSLGH